MRVRLGLLKNVINQLLTLYFDEIVKKREKCQSRVSRVSMNVTAYVTDN